MKIPHLRQSGEYRKGHPSELGMTRAAASVGLHQPTASRWLAALSA
jgi:LysR family transcriptional activator of glutamate synthase operon